ncbi:hypothetical protein GCM10010172_11120 [Paractinoplanes ferrugineus]|uniref:UDP-N-acetylglucosamine kinase n=1 Tax=Paractinoplanes ferrugineus TaxID=113564 RepID=A0A919M7Q9_9ACTN|nr:AAA family ATPase [Actinoplanes ferrugineus]GIE09676.1 hypothetical protein Afe05nite_15160 [Actinoplanes ferrugineus]
MHSTSASVVVITGAMAAGKSTIAHGLAERFPRAAHVRGDTFRRMIVSGRAELEPDETAAATAQVWLRLPTRGNGRRWLDTSEQPPEHTIAEVLARMSEARIT